MTNLFATEEETATRLITLPLPPRILSTNPRSNQGLHIVQSTHKKECRATAKETLWKAGIEAKKVKLSFCFCIGNIRKQECPHKRRPPKPGKTLKSCQRCPYAPRDKPNALGAAKSYIDGIADGLGIEDSQKYLDIGGIQIDNKRGPWLEILVEVLA